ncbi:hypothetical protein [Paraburkholderia silvatlantica]|uniref:hypothetical protein n=1 Tax=Paraburkholderia silvatlantica TaxID=321895 RepID=UPI003751BFC8
MIDTKTEVAKRLSALIGLDVSWVSHAGDMLTMQFGPQRKYILQGKTREDGAWALHVQCDWKLEQDNRTVATRENLRGSDEKARDTTKCLHEVLLLKGPVMVERVSADTTGGVVLSFSQGFRLGVVPDGVKDDEDWRFFAPGLNAAHLVIEGGAVAPESFD